MFPVDGWHELESSGGIIDYDLAVAAEPQRVIREIKIVAILCKEVRAPVVDDKALSFNLLRIIACEPSEPRARGPGPCEESPHCLDEIVERLVALRQVGEEDIRAREC